MNIEEKTLRSKHDILLQFTLFSPENFDEKKAVIISPAMAVKQRYYMSFATHLSDLGYFAITFDNLGVGETHINDLNYYDWAVYDLTLIIEWVENNICLDITFIGHSAGGQLLGLSPLATKISKIFIINSGTGYWRLWPFPRKLVLLTMWYLIFPFFLKLYGYSPKWAMGEKLPKGIISQWLKWGKKKNFMLDFDDISKNNFFKDITTKLHGISFTDDTYAPYKAAQKLLSFYTNADIEFTRHKPKDLGYKKIGHFGFFKSKYNDLWPMITDLI